jgi:phosphate transport system substrate-binding protein
MKNIIKLIAVLALFGTTSVSARDYISIVGSSTVYPFATLVAEKMASEGMKAPVIESTGSGGGHKLFCAGVGVEHPDITNSSRAQKDSEFNLCQDGGVTDIIEVRVGNDGIAFAYAADYEWKYTNGATMKGGIDLSKEEIWQAMARDNADAPTTWYEIDKRLPKVEISIMAPPPTSGTRDAFDSLVMKKGCVKDMLVADGECTAYREDGHVIEGGENDELYVEHITKEQGAFGIFGYSFVSNNSDKVKASMINSVEISMEGIQDYSYPIARPLFFYIKKAHIGVIPGLMDYVNEFVSEEATEGYLLDAGLVQLSPADRAAVLDAISNQTNYK